MAYITIEEVAARLCVCKRTAESMLAGGAIPAPVRIGRLRRWDSDLLDAWMRERAEAAAAMTPGSAPRRGPGRPRGS